MLKQPIVRTIFAIALGAIAGALSRYYLGLVIAQYLGSEMPYGTLIINVTGCFFMGFLTVLSSGQVVSIHPDIRLLLLTGFLGSYTTFSSYELDSAKLLQHRRLEPGLLYWMGSTVLGFISLQLGIVLAEWSLNKLERKRSG
ncbi:MAG: fluoride efflux transporter CrcB [Coleofasciculaceae cyanobacterium]